MLTQHAAGGESHFVRFSLDKKTRKFGLISVETVSTITSDFKYVAKIDCYEYLNLHDIQYCATDAYFYTQSKATGKKVNTSIKGYAVARYEKGTKHDASSGRIYGYGNAEAWSDGCGNWSYDAHYYGTAIK